MQPFSTYYTQSAWHYSFTSLQNIQLLCQVSKNYFSYCIFLSSNSDRCHNLIYQFYLHSGDRIIHNLSLTSKCYCYIHPPIHTHIKWNYSKYHRIKYITRAVRSTQAGVMLSLKRNFWLTSLFSKGYQKMKLTSQTLLNRLNAIPSTALIGLRGTGITLGRLPGVSTLTTATSGESMDRPWFLLSV